MKEKKQHAIKFDPILFISLLILCILGCIFIYSSSNYIAGKDDNDSFFFLKKQLLGYFLGWIVFFIASIFDYKKIKKYALIAFIISLVLLVLVLTPLGKESYGAKRWISVGGFTVQPSEITKMCFVIFVSAYFSNDMSRASTFKGIFPVLIAGGVTCLLIMAEPNMSVTVCIGALMVALLFISGMKIKYLLMIAIPVIFVIPLLILLEPYRLKRLMAFLDPWSSPKGEGYQLIQSLYALGSGGLFGVGVFNSRQKMRFLPFAESDFILSVIGEETGFVGIILLFILCGIIVWRTIKIAKNSQDFFGYLLCVGFCCVFVIQIAVNALVVTGSIPPTGLPFPLISSGNTQIITFLASFGIVNNVCIKSKKDEF